jgi:hypothetical protein
VVENAELFIKRTYGLDIDIPEDVIKQLIEKNLLENPEIFGSRKPAPVVEE